MVTQKSYGKIVIGLIVAVVIALVMALSSAKATEPFPSRGTSAVVDTANIFTPTQFNDLNKRLVQWQRKTKHQLVVVTIPTLNGQDIKTYGYQLGRAWRLGQTGSSDAAILLYSAKEYRLRIEVGLGLEPVLTDAMSLQIITETARPKIMDRDTAGGLIAAADGIMEHIDANESDVIIPDKITAVDNANNSDEIFGALIIIAIGLLGLIGVFMLNSRSDKRRQMLNKKPYPKGRDDLGSPPHQGTFVNKESAYKYTAPGTTSSSSYRHITIPPVRTPPPLDDDATTNVAGAALGGYAAGQIVGNQVTDFSDYEDTRKTDSSPSESYGFISNNDDDRSFGGGGADVDCSPGSDD